MSSGFVISEQDILNLKRKLDQKRKTKNEKRLVEEYDRIQQELLAMSDSDDDDDSSRSSNHQYAKALRRSDFRDCDDDDDEDSGECKL